MKYVQLFVYFIKAVFSSKNKKIVGTDISLSILMIYTVHDLSQLILCVCEDSNDRVHGCKNI